MAVVLVQSTTQTIYLKQWVFNPKTGWKVYSQSRIPYEVDDTRFRRAVSRRKDGVTLFKWNDTPGKNSPVKIDPQLIEECENELERSPFNVKQISFGPMPSTERVKEIKPSKIELMHEQTLKLLKASNKPIPKFLENVCNVR